MNADNFSLTKSTQSMELLDFLCNRTADVCGEMFYLCNDSIVILLIRRHFDIVVKAIRKATHNDTCEQ